MAETYNNVPMSEDEQKRVAAQDAAWTGPKLVVLCAITLGGALALLWAMANNIIGPTINQ
ncbi:MAG: hypothetical protein AAGE52_13300 [Myxococcota bacterium]